MTGISVTIQYDPTGKPFMALVVDSGMSNTQIWIADKSTAIHNVAEITRQLKVASADLLQTADKLIEVKGSLDGIHDQSRRIDTSHATRRPPQRPRSTRP